MSDNSVIRLQERVNELCEEAWGLRYTDYEALYKSAKEAYEISKDISYGTGTGRSTVLIALYNRKNGYPEKFLYELISIKDTMEKNDNDLWVSRMYYTIGPYYGHRGNYAESLSAYLKVIDRSKKLNDKNLYIASLSNIGTIYHRVGKYEEALKYYNEGMELIKGYGDKGTAILVYLNSGETYVKLKNYEKAIECCKKGLEFIDDKTTSEWSCYANNVLGSAYKGLGLIEEAIRHYEIAAYIYEHDRAAYSYPYIRAKINLGRIYSEKKNNEEAIKHLKEALQLAETTDSNDTLPEIFLLLADIYGELKDYKNEIYYFKKGTELEKKIIPREVEQRIHAILLKHNLERSKKNTEINRLKNVELKQKSEELEKKASEINLALKNLKEVQTQLIQTEKMAALGQLVAGIAHEINTPLGAIQASITNMNDDILHMHTDTKKLMEIMNSDKMKLFFDLSSRCAKADKVFSPKEKRTIRKNMVNSLENLGINDAEYAADMLIDMDVYDNAEEFLPILLSEDMHYILQTAYYFSGLWRNSRNIDSAIGKASKIVFALNNYSHPESAKRFVKDDIIANIETVITLYYNQIKRNVELVRNYSDIPQIMCIPDDLNQVWTNLIQNALQAMEYNGKIVIDIYEKEGYINVNITDNGEGIPGSIKDKIFEPFFTTKMPGEGTGLGLDIVRKIIKEHNGGITFESVPGCTTFFVRLPVEHKVQGLQ